MRVWTSRCPVAMSILLLGGTSARAQSPAPSPPTLVFPSETSLLHIDAIALDQAGLPVSDMKAEDFAIEFAGRKFTPRVAAFVSLAEPRSASERVPLPGEKPRPEEAQRVIVFFVVNPVLDVLDSSDADSLAESLATRTMQSALRMSRLLEHYVDRLAGPRDLAAIARAESRRVALSDLTTDRAVLRQAIDDVRTRWLEGPPINVGPGMLSIFDRRIAEMIDQAAGAVRAIRRVPGRKLMFISSRFLRSGRDYTQASDALRRLRDAANQSGVTIYGLDPAGPTADASRSREGDKVTPLRELAAATGGRLIANTNNLEGEVERALDENRGYYILGFEPDASVRGRPTGIRVRSRRDGVDVRARETLAPDLNLQAEPGFLDGLRLAELADSPFSPRGLDVGLDVAVRWSDSGEPEAEVAATVIGTSPSPIRLEVLTRILTEERRIVFQEERPMILRPRDASRPLRFSTTRKLNSPEKNGSRGPLKDGAVIQVDVALRDRGSRATGAARRILEVPLPHRDRLVLTRPVLRATGVDAFVASAFPPGASVLMQVQAAGLKRSAGGRTQVEIASRFLRNGRIVRAEPVGRIEDRLPDPFNIDGRISLAGLEPGVYEIEVAITDLVGRKTVASASAFSIR